MILSRDIWRPSVEYRACDVVIELYFLGYRSPEQLNLILKWDMFGTRYGIMDLKVTFQPELFHLNQWVSGFL